MSFSLKVKEELSKLSIGSISEIKAELYGVFLQQKCLGKSRIKIKSANKILVERVFDLISAISNINNTVKVNKDFENNFYTLRINDTKNFIEKMFSADNSKIDMSYIKNTNLKDFLRGIFIAGGTLTNPVSNYHLEIGMPIFSLSLDLFSILENANKIDFKPNATRRRKGSLIYIKDSEKITDFLTFIGAKSSAMEIMQIKMVKEVRNHINRTTNFETANLSKITNSAAEQIQAIKIIKSAKKIEFLSENLQETANLRLSHPYSSLEELAALCKALVSKSGINHRLKKLIKISQKL